MALEPQGALPPAQRVAERVFGTVDRFLHVEAASGVVLLVAAITALILANSSASVQYERFWHAHLTLGIGSFVASESLHFWVNEGLMTVFFLVVGLEIRRELHDGDLATLRRAALPLAAAVGGILVPAAIYVSLNLSKPQINGWGVPTATDIAFAVGVLAIIGRSIPRAARTFLLALAVIDDVAGVLIIALFYSSGIDASGVMVAAAGVLLALAFQVLGIRRAWIYTLPALVVWVGFLQSGVHPTLAGVVLGLITPVKPLQAREPPILAATTALRDLAHRVQTMTRGDAHAIREPLRRLQDAERELLPPVTRVQSALHPWVAFLVMPMFALANAGIDLRSIDMGDSAGFSITVGVVLALVLGKPAGIVLGAWLAVSSARAELPAAISWQNVVVVGFLGGIGFTMSIFIATLAFPEQELLAAAKLGVLVGSGVAGILGFALGRKAKTAIPRPVAEVNSTGAGLNSRRLDRLADVFRSARPGC
jgi:NhaA family Na+:H+ antiporter